MRLLSAGEEFALAPSASWYHLNSCAVPDLLAPALLLFPSRLPGSRHGAPPAFLECWQPWRAHRRHWGWLVGISNSRGDPAPCVLRGWLPPGATAFGCFCSRAQRQDPGAGRGSCVLRASPSSAPHLADGTGDIAGVAFTHHNCRRACQTMDSGKARGFQRQRQVWGSQSIRIQSTHVFSALQP